MEFKKIAILSSFLSKSYAKGMLRMLYSYRSLSASEAASRLDIHIRTAQDFLEALSTLNLLEKKEVNEGKRPYFRYLLKDTHIQIDIDLAGLFEESQDEKEFLNWKLREKKNSQAKFSTARNGQFFSSFSIWTGSGRGGKERKINLTEAQGRFMFNLPFPEASVQSVKQIMGKSNVELEYLPEILDLVVLLKDFGVVEMEDQ